MKRKRISFLDTDYRDFTGFSAKETVLTCVIRARFIICEVMDYIYELTMKVRDYECDLQGIVNNANYQHYLEHTRHEFLLNTGVSFAALHEQGVDPVVARISMSFKTPLKSGDEFVSKLYMKKEGIKYVFYQDIFRASDGKVCLKGIVETVCVVNGRLSDSELFDNIFAPYLKSM